VHFSQNIEPSSIAKASDSILVCASDVEETIYMVTLEQNGVMSLFDKPSRPRGAKETISSQTQSSVSMMQKGLQDLQELLQELNTSYQVDLHSCLTVQVENLHATGHFKDQFPTSLHYARNLANAVYESIKRVVRWAAYYYTHEKTYYPVIPQITPLNALPRMSHLKPTRKLKNGEQVLMREWAANYGKAVRQRTVSQETTMFKAGTFLHITIKPVCHFCSAK